MFFMNICMRACKVVGRLCGGGFFTPENDSNEILTQVIGLTCSGQTGRIHRADFDVWGLAEER